MRILILEDDDNRNSTFQRNFCSEQTEVVIVKEAIHAINYLNNENWDVLFLDHDLGGAVHVAETEENTGSAVARWLNVNPKKEPAIVIIHSLNNDGRLNMKRLIPKAIIFPFAWIKLNSYVLLSNATQLDLHKLASDQMYRLETYGKL